jgi:hypothetical protein
MKRKLGGEEVEGVGVMKDEELKFEEIEVSHTLDGDSHVKLGCDNRLNTSVSRTYSYYVKCGNKNIFCFLKR